jgi:hypothetical protein
VRSLYARTRIRRNARLRTKSWCARIIARLEGVWADEENRHLRYDVRQAIAIVSLAAKGDPQPLVTSSYSFYACHPDKVWENIVSQRKAKLGKEYSQWFDKSGNYIRERWDIPDYDPTLGPIPMNRSKVNAESGFSHSFSRRPNLAG